MFSLFDRKGENVGENNERPMGGRFTNAREGQLGDIVPVAVVDACRAIVDGDAVWLRPSPCVEWPDLLRLSHYTLNPSVQMTCEDHIETLKTV